MKETVALAKGADAKKGFSPTRRDNNIQGLRNEPERQLGSLRGVIDAIRRDGGKPSAESIATELSNAHTAQRASVLLALQQTHGNRYVQRVVAGIQAKLVVGQPGDIYEQEADRVADEVMRMPEPGVQRQVEEEEEEEELMQSKPLAEQITPLVQRQVEEEEEKKEEETLQAKEVSRQSPEVTPNLEPRIDALKGRGQPLPKSARAFFEPRFGFDFSQVRIHTDTKAADLARAVNALAYTVGRDVVFGAGQYAPRTGTSRLLLAHELTHSIQQGANMAFRSGPERGRRFPLSVSRVPSPVVQRLVPPVGTASTFTTMSQRLGASSVPAPTTITSPPMTSASNATTRVQFEQTMMQRFEVRQIFTGTFEQQRDRLNHFGAGSRPGDQLSRSSWNSWDPGTSSSVYDWIVAAFDEFARRAGGVPPVQEVGFYDTDYGLDSTGTLVPKPNVGADYGGGHMAIYRAVTTGRFPLPIGRSITAGAYAPVSVAVGGIRGQSPGAPLPLPTREQDVMRAISHELGHGLVETALTPRAGGPAADPTMMDDYRREVGWTAGSSPMLFDAGVPAVRTALASGTTSPATYQITEDNWNDPRWVEQPLTVYMVSAPWEDFPEAVMAYVNEPNLLLARSPRRYQFLYTRKARWLPYLLRLPQIGDFPEPTRRDIRLV